MRSLGAPEELAVGPEAMDYKTGLDNWLKVNPLVTFSSCLLLLSFSSTATSVSLARHHHSHASCQARHEKIRSGKGRKANNLGMTVHLSKEIYKEAPVHCNVCLLVSLIGISAAIVLPLGLL